MENKNENVEVYSVTNASLATLKGDYAVTKVIEDNKELKLSKEGVAKIRGLRSQVTEEHKKFKAPILERGRLIDAEKKRVLDELLAIETPIKNEIQAYEAKKELARQEKLKFEKERIAKLEKKVKILDYGTSGRTWQECEALLETLGSFDLTKEDYEEFEDKAYATLSDSIARLRSKRDELYHAECEAKRLAEEKAELEAAQSKQREAEAKLKADQDKLDEAKRIEQKKLDDEKAKFEAEKAAHAKKIEDEALAKRESEEAEERAKVEAKHKEQRDAEVAKKLKEQAEKYEKLKPDLDKIEAYIDRVKDFICQEVSFLEHVESIERVGKIKEILINTIETFRSEGGQV